MTGKVEFEHFVTLTSQAQLYHILLTLHHLYCSNTIFFLECLPYTLRGTRIALTKVRKSKTIWQSVLTCLKERDSNRSSVFARLYSCQSLAHSRNVFLIWGASIPRAGEKVPSDFT